MINKEEIWDLYAYSKEELEASKQFLLYKEKISKCQSEIFENPNKLKRYAIVGLYIDYRSANHAGVEFKSTDYNNWLGNTSQRLEKIRDVIGYPINNAAHYEKLLGFSFFQKYNWMVPLHKKFIQYVLSTDEFYQIED